MIGLTQAAFISNFYRLNLLTKVLFTSLKAQFYGDQKSD